MALPPADVRHPRRGILPHRHHELALQVSHPGLLPNRHYKLVLQVSLPGELPTVY